MSGRANLGKKKKNNPCSAELVLLNLGLGVKWKFSARGISSSGVHVGDCCRSGCSRIVIRLGVYPL